jgi:hypothetical protein
MIYDELLERINRYSKTRSLIDTIAWNSLRLIIELHKPQEITLPDGSWGANCVQCDGWDYPCLTIQAIQKEIK